MLLMNVNKLSKHLEVLAWKLNIGDGCLQIQNPSYCHPEWPYLIL